MSALGALGTPGSLGALGELGELGMPAALGSLDTLDTLGALGASHAIHAEPAGAYTVRVLDSHPARLPVKPPLLLALLALVLSALALAVALRGGSTSAGVEPPPPALTPVGAEADLAARVAALEEAQRRRGATLPPAGVPSAPSSRRTPEELVTRAELEAQLAALRAELEGRGEAPVGDAGESREELRLRDAYAEAVEDQSFLTGTLDGRLASWTRWLSLDAAQRASLREHLDRRDRAGKDALRDWASGLDYASVQELGRIADAQLRASVRALLDAEQLARYDERFPAPDGP